MRHKTLWVCLALLSAPLWMQAAPARTASASGGAADADITTGAHLPNKAPPLPAAVAADPPIATEKPAEVRAGDTVVFTLQAARAGRSAALRARSASEALREALLTNAGDVHVEHTGATSVVYVGERPVVQLTQEDAILAGDSSLAVHADRIAAGIRTALKTERERSALASSIFNVSLAVLFAVLAVFLLRRAWQLAERAGTWLTTHPERVPALRLRTLEVLNRATVRTSLSLGLAIGRWIALFGLVYAWLIATFSLFEVTQGFTGRLTGALLSPLATLASRIAAAVPLLVVVVFALLTLALVLRAVQLFFAEVARGTTSIAWLPRDLAPAFGRLTQIAIVILALVLAAPVITGNAEGAAPRLGLMLLAALALASVPLVASTVVGAITLFGRWLSVGDWVELGGRAGRVMQISLLETTLRDASGVDVKVPHLVRLWQPTRMHGPARRVTTTLQIERAVLTPALASRVEQVLAQAGSDAVVRLIEVGATHATLELGITSSAAGAGSDCLWAALAEIDTAHHRQD